MEITDTNNTDVEQVMADFRKRMKERIERVRRLIDGVPSEKNKVAEFRPSVKEHQNA